MSSSASPLSGIFLALALLCGARGEEVLSDVNFERGLALSALDSRADPVVVGTLFAGQGTPAPAWRLAQWGSRFNLLSAPPRTVEAETVYENEGKLFGLRGTPDSGKIVRMQVNAIAEYDGRLRADGEAWPHLLIEQPIKSLPRLCMLESFRVAFDIRIPKVEPLSAPLDDGRHAAQFVMFFTLQDRNRDSKGCGDYLWFGIPIYDSRREVPRGHRARDGGTGQYIHSVEGRMFWKKNIGDGAWHSFDADVLPHMLDAFEDARKKGYLKNSRFEDIAIASTNSGWEVPGPFDVESEFKNFSARATLKSRPGLLP